LTATYHRLKARRGRKRACLALGHRMLRIVHRILRTQRPYEEEGLDYYRAPDKDRLKGRLVQRLRKLSYSVTVGADKSVA
jgi:hypothetical protein